MGKGSWTHRLRAVFGPAIVASVLVSACSAPAPTPPPAAEQTAQAGQTAAALSPTAPADGAQIVGGRLVARAQAVPAFVVDLSFELSGVIKEVLVSEGEAVVAGQPIARLDGAEVELDLEDAQARLRAARAEYEKLVAGATPEQVQRAQTQLDRARASLRARRGEVGPADFEAARRDLEEARLSLASLLDGPDPEDIEIAKAQLEEADAELEAAKARLASDKVVNENLIAVAANNVRETQAAWDEIYWENAPGRESGELDPDDAEREAQAKRDMDDAQTLLENRRIIYEEMRQLELANIASGEAKVRVATLRLQDVQGSIDDEDIAAARANLASAEARIARLEGEQRAGELQAAEAQLAEAEANMAILMADPRTEDLALAEVTVERAEVGLKQAQLNLQRLAITAPNAGTITQLNLTEGEVIEARKPLVQLADLANWRLETDSLSELNVVYIREGDTAKITFFALPGVELSGQVVQIMAEGTSDRNAAVTYRATIVPDSWDPRLRWNMSASVAITPAQP